MKYKQIIKENLSDSEILSAIKQRLAWCYSSLKNFNYNGPTDIQFQDIPISMNITGRLGAEFCYPIDSNTGKHKLRYRFNPTLARENFEDYIKNTVPHEACHYLQFEFAKKRKVPSEQPHGPVWVAAMRHLRLVPDVRHMYNVRNVPSQQKLVKLQCPKHPDIPYAITVRKGRNHVWLLRTGAKGYVCNVCKESLKIINPESLE